jgi:hypothetical protein
MYIFDTDHLSLIQRNRQEGKRILAKLAEIEDPEVAVTIITYEEQIRGKLAFLAKAKILDEQISAYLRITATSNQLPSDRHYSLWSRICPRTSTLITQSLSPSRKYGSQNCRDRLDKQCNLNHP